MRGNIRSSTINAGASVRAFLKPSAPSCATIAEKPSAFRNWSVSRSTTSGSSSTIRIFLCGETVIGDE
jgi:hypothetical protein